MEELIANYSAARAIFTKWMEWKPEEKAWLAFIKFEERMHEFERCREIMYRYMDAYPRLRTYMKVAHFEIKRKNREAARLVFEKTIEDLGMGAF